MGIQGPAGPASAPRPLSDPGSSPAGFPDSTRHYGFRFPDSTPLFVRRHDVTPLDVPWLGRVSCKSSLRGFDLHENLDSNRPTARRYLDILGRAYLVRVLPPWVENLKKRQIKAPKVYLRDSGLR